MCGAKAGGVSSEGVDLTTEAVVQGVVTRDGEPVGTAYVRLLDASGEFTAEAPVSATGQFRFFARPGTWTVRALAPGSEPVDEQVVAATGMIAELEVRVG